jgi:S-adenosylmethionine synthetase
VHDIGQGCSNNEGRSNRSARVSQRLLDRSTRLTDLVCTFPGASGVLGRSVTNHFHKQSISTLPLSFSRKSPSVLYPDLPAPTPLDLLDEQTVRRFFTSLQSDSERKIDFLIHCAAERRPDVAEADPERAARLNEASTRLLAELAAELDFGLVYISTDYVFDGKKPPYSSGDVPNPLNLYGRLKRSGEEAVLDVRAKAADEAKPLIVLRVPLL